MMAEDRINAFKKKRTVLRASATKIITKLEAEVNKLETDTNEMELLIELLNDKFEALKIVDNDLENTLSVDELEKEIESSEEYRERIIACKFKAKKCLLSLTVSENRNLSLTEVSAFSASGETNTKYRETISVKLPKITIPKFYGDINQWLTFWNSFETAIDKNDNLDQVDKFNYLKAHLGGTALNTVEGFSISSENYVKAVKLLRDRFARKDILVNTHMNNLMQMPPLIMSNDAKSFREFFDYCQTQIRSLESLDISMETFSTLMCPMILNLLPHDLVFSFNKLFDSGEYKINDIIEFLGRQLNALEKADANAFSRQNHSTFSFSARQKEVPTSYDRNKNGWMENENHYTEKNQANLNTAANLFGSEIIKDKKTRLNCVFCDKIHNENECNVAKGLSYEERKRALLKNGCCFKCIKVGHLSKTCKVLIKCSLCGKRHSSIMCFSLKKPFEKKKENYECIDNKVLANNSCAKEVHLQTLIVNLTENNNTYFVRAIYDTGSQRSYISKFIAETLNLKCFGDETVTHGLFGGLEKKEKHKKYSIKICGINRNFTCDAEVMDQDRICAPIPKLNDAKCINKLKKSGIFLSDIALNDSICLFEKDPQEIHILLGADIAGKMFTGEVKHLTKELMAINSLLGWTVMGKTGKVNTKRSGTLLSLFVNDAKIEGLCKLDTLGIRDYRKRREGKEVEEAYYWNNAHEQLQEIAKKPFVNHLEAPLYRLQN